MLNGQSAQPGVEGRWGVRLTLLLAVAMFVGLRARVVSLPLERDEGEYAYIASRLADGVVPYKDAFLQKTPATVFVYAAAFDLLGKRAQSVHLAMYVFSALTGVALFVLVTRLEDARAGALAALAFAVTSVEPRLLATAANTEQFALLPLTLGLLAFVWARRTGRARWWFVSGAACAMALWFKQVALAPVALVAAYGLIQPVGASGAERASSRPLALAAWLGGGAVVCAVFIGYLVRCGAWSAFMDCAFEHNLEYARRVSWVAGMTALGRALFRQLPVFVGVWALGLIAMFSRRASGDDRPAGLPDSTVFFLVWFALASVAIAAPLNFFQHYFVWGLPPICALAGLGAARMIALARRRGGPAVAAVAWAVAILPMGATLAANPHIWFAPSAADMSAAMYGENVFAESRRIGSYIREHGAPTDTVFILGSEPQILFHADRRSATRYIIMYPLFGPYADARARQREVIGEITRDRPKWILDVRLANSRTPDPNAPRDLVRSTAGLLLPGQGYVLVGLAIPRPERRRFELIWDHAARERAARGGLPKVGVLLYVRAESPGAGA